MGRNRNVCGVLVLIMAVSCCSVLWGNAANEKGETMLVWADGAPGALGDEAKDKPELTIYLPPKEKANGAAVLICPGGGYGMVSMDNEGHMVAAWLNELGVAGIVLRYRLPSQGYPHPAPLQDVQRAMRIVRANAGEWKIDSARIGVMGFSAGGHLAASLGTHYDAGKADARDEIERQKCRPDFMMLIYPVISMADDITHHGSKNNLLGKEPSEELQKLMSNELQVTPDTPPTFLTHADDDDAVPSENSVRFYLALRKAKVSAEMHIYQYGLHGLGEGKGYGLDPRRAGPGGTWPARAAEWMERRGLLDGKNGENGGK